MKRVGRRIRAPKVRLLSAQGEDLGIVATEKAMRMAEEQGLELVEVDVRADPPVCRMMDFARFKYEVTREERAARRLIPTHQTKQVRVKDTIAAHDLALKVDKLRRFLSDGHICQLIVVSDGDQTSGQQTRSVVVERVVSALADVSLGGQNRAVGRTHVRDGAGPHRTSRLDQELTRRSVAGVLLLDDAA